MKRFRLRLGALAAALVVALGLVTWQALEAAEREMELRRRIVAERVYDELERGLTEFLAVEEARSVEDFVLSDGPDFVLQRYERDEAPATADGGAALDEPIEVPQQNDAIQVQAVAQAMNTGFQERQERVPGNMFVEGVEVVVDNFVARDEGLAIVLERRVGDGHQALVVDVEELQWHLEERVEGDFTVNWEGTGHVFAPPFEMLHASAELGDLPGPASPKRWVVALAALLVGLLGLALWSVDRMVLLSLRSAEEREGFVSAVSHELRSPLTSIRMYAEMLEQGMAGDDYARTIRVEAERLNRLVDDLLEYGQREQALDGPKRPIGDVVDDLERLFAPRIALQIAVPKDIRSAEVDGDALAQVLVNLVDNALKFAPDSVVSIRGTRDGGQLVLVVRDQGPGVPTSQLNRLAEPFFRGERELVRETRGTGIGMALVASLVERMGGSLSWRNHPDGGLEVRVSLFAN